MQCGSLSQGSKRPELLEESLFRVYGYMKGLPVWGQHLGGYSQQRLKR